MKKYLLSLIVTLVCISTYGTSIAISKIEAFNYRVNAPSIFEIEKDVNVFMFFSASCPCSKSYFEYLNGLARTHSNIGFVGFHSSKTLSIDTAKNYFSDKKIEFPIFSDKNLVYADLFKALKTPHVFILNKTGEILYHGAVADSRHINSAKNFYLEEALKDISGGVKPKLEFAKALGCYINR